MTPGSSAPPVRVLFLSDSHLGLDLPSRPKVERRRRGDDLFESFERALAPAHGGEVDLVVHGGDLFFRSKVPAWLAEDVYGRLGRLADQGVDVFVLPGNHERSAAPRSLFLDHPRVRLFDRPRTFVVQRGGVSVAVSGLPYCASIRADAARLVEATGHATCGAAIRLLVLHQLVEGARVGPSGYTFRAGDDVLPGSAVPSGFAAVLCGHVHRHQVLTRDLAGRKLAAPVLYPGSTDRTSFAEKDERKGFLMLELGAGKAPGGVLVRHEFRELPVRPMVEAALDVGGAGADEVGERLRALLARLDPSSLVKVRLQGEPLPGGLAPLGAAALREAAPETMTVTVVPRGGFRGKGRGGAGGGTIEDPCGEEGET